MKGCSAEDGGGCFWVLVFFGEHEGLTSVQWLEHSTGLLLADDLYPGMAFGKNPYVPKAQGAEQKAQDAPDDIARERAFRDAAHQWDRAAEREPPGKKRSEYEANAARNRELADGGGNEPEAEDEAAVVDPKLLN